MQIKALQSLRRSPSASALRINDIRYPFYRNLPSANQSPPIITTTYQKMDTDYRLTSNCTQPLVLRACPLCSYVPLRRSSSASALRMNDIRSPFYRNLPSANPSLPICTSTYKKMDTDYRLTNNCTQPLVLRACIVCSYAPLRRSPSASALRMNDIRYPFYS